MCLGFVALVTVLSEEILRMGLLWRKSLASTSMLKREPQRSTVVVVVDVSLCTKFPEYKLLVRGSDG